MFKHPTADIFIDEEGFIWIRFKEKAELTRDTAYEYARIFEELCDGEPRHFIIDTRGSRATTTIEFRQLIGNDPKALRWRIADAILVNSLHKRLVGNFYMKFETPNLPVRLFGTESEAKEWLLKN